MKKLRKSYHYSKLTGNLHTGGGSKCPVCEEEEEAGWCPPTWRPPAPPVPLPKYTPDEIIEKFSKP